MRAKRFVGLSASVVLLLALVWGIPSILSSSPYQEMEQVGALYVGPLEVAYEGCSADQQAALAAALAGIADTKVSCGGIAGVIGADLLKCLHEKEMNITLICGGGGCDTNPRLNGEAPVPGDWIRMCARTFQNADRLQAVLFHEMVHTCGRGEKDAEACQNACYEGRGATAPDAGEEGGSCDGGGGSGLALSYNALIGPQDLNLQGILTSVKEIYAHGEPITIAFRLQNIGATEAITVTRSWYDPNANSLGIFDRQGRQKPSLILWETRPPDLENFVVLSPGDAFSDTFAITADYYGALAAGPYTLTVTYTNPFTGHYSADYPYSFVGSSGAWTGTLRSNDIRILIYQRLHLPFAAKSWIP